MNLSSDGVILFNHQIYHEFKKNNNTLYAKDQLINQYFSLDFELHLFFLPFLKHKSNQIY